MSVPEKSGSDSPVPLRKPRLLRDFQPSVRVLWMDRAARTAITSFGIFVILAVALILVFIGKEAWPLFQAPSSKPLADLRLPALGQEAHLLTWNVDEFQTYSYGLADDGNLDFIQNSDGALKYTRPIAELTASPPTLAWASPKGDFFLAVTAGGRLKAFEVTAALSHDRDGARIQMPGVREFPSVAISAPPGEKPVGKIRRLAAAYNASEESLAVALLTMEGRLLTGRHDLRSGAVEWRFLKTPGRGRVTGLAVDMEGKYLVLTTDANELLRWDLENTGDAPIENIHPSSAASHVSSLGVLLGNATWILGFADGSVEAWSVVRQPLEGGETMMRFQKIRSFEAHPARVSQIFPSGVNRSFWTTDDRGGLKMHFNPSARKLYNFDLKGPIAGVAPNAQLNGMSVLMHDGTIRQWTLHNPHPDVNWSTLFDAVWYEGYDGPRFIWQSSSGSDNFEAKYSLVPLAIGTVKGAFYGLAFAIPIAVLAALYTSQLMHPRIRSVVKPTIEIMAALPSVVIGFLAGLWIAPFLEKHLVEATLILPVFVGLIFLAAWLFFKLPLSVRNRLPQEVELGIMLGMVGLAFLLSHLIASPLEATAFGGHVQQWIYDTLGQKVEQRNCLVIGLAMGFAVIPIIFSISEDAMSNVPRHYVSGSLALGATPWQSAVRVILPTASPGIFSAIMLGFGRAVGETMIVLMATGNTPIMSFSPFNGMRTFSANIAVEMPEAPCGGSLYRILFLSAVLLFLLTFFINTAAEIVRLRLREKYRAM